ncbi:hypothetical protein TNIN_193771 [Trichonephila inaurata madagascariensis]|uniref:Uncharacterized protein n=1 Tax=Trichonephila inaurata madagascariensis TaxID=2747483 RepID=A0A8X6YCZ2_9ARAC|nr:hypothetical protein TNIN_193771 [Trichonephila inaurata madagascariensis]
MYLLTLSGTETNCLFNDKCEHCQIKYQETQCQGNRSLVNNIVASLRKVFCSNRFATPVVQTIYFAQKQEGESDTKGEVLMATPTDTSISTSRYVSVSYIRGR